MRRSEGTRAEDEEEAPAATSLVDVAASSFKQRQGCSLRDRRARGIHKSVVKHNSFI